MFQESGTQDLVSVSIADTISRGLNNFSQITFLRGSIELFMSPSQLDMNREPGPWRGEMEGRKT